MPEQPPPMKRVKYHGATLNARTRDMIKYAEALAGFTFAIGQGSYNTGVAASAGTHDGGGAVDLSVRNLTPSQRVKMVRALKDAGFAAWYRPALVNVWPSHVHAIAIGDAELAPLAKYQVTAFKNGRDGLKSNRVDNTYRPNPAVRWDYRKSKPVKAT